MKLISLGFCLAITLCAAASRPFAPLPASAATIDTVAGTGAAKDNGPSGDADKINIVQPFGVEIGPDGALYVTEVGNHRVRRLDRKTGRITTVAGNGQKGYSGDGGLATKARLNEPYEVRFDRRGDMYFVEMKNHLIRRVDAKTGVISTVAGTGKPGYAGDGGPARRAQFQSPHSIALAEDRWLFVADIGNHRIRRIDLTEGTIRTIAGTGERTLPKDGQQAVGRPMLGPRALFYRDGVLWIALREGHSVWALDTKSGKLRHIAGSGKRGYTGDGGPALAATFNGPKGIALGPKGNTFVVDTENQAIRRIDRKSRRIRTLAGAGPSARGFGGDSGPATTAKMDRPHGVCVDSQGVVYIGDTNNHRVRRVRP